MSALIESLPELFHSLEEVDLSCNSVSGEERLRMICEFLY